MPTKISLLPATKPATISSAYAAGLIAETELVALPEVAIPLLCVVIARVLHRRVRDLRLYLDPTPLARLPETAH